jgi:hypothetical protein
MAQTVEAERLAALLRLLKERSGCSFEALARRTGVSGSSLHRYCAGTKIPSDYGVVETFARVCGASQHELGDLHRLWLLTEASRQQADGQQVEEQPAGEQEADEQQAPADDQQASGEEAGARPPATPAPPRGRFGLPQRAPRTAAGIGAVTVAVAAVSAWAAAAYLRPAAGPLVPVGHSILLENVSTGMCADIPWMDLGVPGGPVQQHRCVAGADDNQMWVFVPSDGGDRTVAIQNFKDRLCMDVPYYGRVAPDTPVTQFGCQADDGDNQLFRPERTGRAGAVRLHHVKSPGLCLDLGGEDGSAPEDTPLSLRSCSKTDDQAWTPRRP